MYCPSSPAGNSAASRSARSQTEDISLASASPPLAGTVIALNFCLTSPEVLF